MKSTGDQEYSLRKKLVIPMESRSSSLQQAIASFARDEKRLDREKMLQRR
jgi:hypothetical protein